ncbi:hypothetical protein [Mycobacterium tuberculosis]|nr:hypothetical protein [Mycobacterium tuberculosis]
MRSDTREEISAAWSAMAVPAALAAPAVSPVAAWPAGPAAASA